jgi:hypothetical protein
LAQGGRSSLEKRISTEQNFSDFSPTVPHNAPRPPAGYIGAGGGLHIIKKGFLKKRNSIGDLSTFADTRFFSGVSFDSKKQSIKRNPGIAVQNDDQFRFSE